MSIAIGDIYRVAARYTLQNQICYNVWHMRANGSATASGAQNLLLGLENQAKAFVTEGLRNGAHTSVNWDLITITGIRGNTKYQRIAELDVNGTGGPSELLPGFVAGVIWFATGEAGRSRRGRMHIGGLTEAYADGGTLTPQGATYLDLVRTRVNVDLMTPANWKLAVWSRVIAEGRKPSEKYPDGVPPNPGDAARDVASVAVSSVLGSMYSRRIGRGS